ncbi:MAG: malto-oligosyltrehalose trehalohydrolase [Candidatus Binataceae bacterium]
MKQDPVWRLEFGANPTEDGVLFRVWAPLATRLSVCVTHPRQAVLPMDRDADGIFTAFAEHLAAGAQYYFQFEPYRRRPDPVSRFQPHGVHDASQVVDRSAFAWADQEWKGLPLEHFIIYELHTGTFTPERTFDGIIGRLPYLRELGITAVEIMPVASFPGARNWGYDGVYLYAPHAAYGGPLGFKRLVDACHREGLAVVLDVVYNHLGPEGNYLGECGPYFTDRYRTPWGAAINFDGPQSDGVRRFFIDNALYWLTEYHVDALRLDAIHQIFDFSARHVIREMAEVFHRQARLLGRDASLIAESDLNDPRVIDSPAIGGHGLDAQWNDDFHHALHALLTGTQHGYFSDFGRIEDLSKAITEGFVYDGRLSAHRQRRYGASSAANPGRQFIVFNQNHDQIANAEAGTRLSKLLTFEQQNVAAMILMCAPNLPMLFMGEEFGASSPFNYFTSFTDPALASAVSEGRRREYGTFFRDRAFADPQAPETFSGSQIDWAETALSPHRELLSLNRALISLRRENRCLSNCRKDLTIVRFSEDMQWMVIRRGDPSGEIALVFCNLGSGARIVPVPREALGLRLALFTGEQRFGGTPEVPSPPAILDSSRDGIELAQFSAALYVGGKCRSGSS